VGKNLPTAQASVALAFIESRFCNAGNPSGSVLP
jgi:hypothetical protein